MVTKAALRKELKRERGALTPEEVEHKSVAIVERLKAIVPWEKIATVHCYDPFESQNEPDVCPLVMFLQSNFPNMDVYTSLKEGSEWPVATWDGTVVEEVPQFNVIIVPMLGFDGLLHRLGQGGGYYDRFLATQLQAQKVGVCFGLGHLETLPIEAHDIPMDVVVTEIAAYKLG